MAKPKAKAKRKITAKEKKARESRRAFERICDRIAAGEGVKGITADSKKAGLSQSGFYKMLQSGDGELVVEIRTRARDPGRPDGRGDHRDRRRRHQRLHGKTGQGRQEKGRVQQRECEPLAAADRDPEVARGQAQSARKRTFICDRIDAGESVKQITADKKAGLSQSGFYRMLGSDDDELVVEIRARARPRPTGWPRKSSQSPTPRTLILRW